MKSDSANKLVKITSVVEKIFGDDLHKKRQQSLAYAAMGVLGSESNFFIELPKGWPIPEELIKNMPLNKLIGF